MNNQTDLKILSFRDLLEYEQKAASAPDVETFHSAAWAELQRVWEEVERRRGQDYLCEYLVAKVIKETAEDYKPGNPLTLAAHLVRN